MNDLIYNLKNNKKIIFICIICIILAIGIYYLLSKDESKEFNYSPDTNVYLKKYGVNEYIPVYMTEEDMAKKYLNDFKNKMINNPSEAYKVLNKEYRDKKFQTEENFMTYLDEYLGSVTYSMTVDKYEIKTINGDKYYNIYTNTDEHYIFKENSIMDYEVFLDEYTINIG